MFRSMIVAGLIVGFVVLPQAAQGEPPGADEGKVQADVYAALKKSAEGTALVEVTLTPVGHEEFTSGERRALVNKRQDEVLARMKPGEFKLTYRPDDMAAMMAGYVNAAGLARFSTDPDVVAVGPGKITSDVSTKLEKSDDGTAFVCVILKAAGKEKSSPKKRKAAIKRVQDKVLARLEPGEFKLAWRFETAEMLVGHINATGVARLANDPDVVMIRPSKINPELFTEIESSDDRTTAAIVFLKRVNRRKWEGSRSQRRLILEEKMCKVKAIQERVLSVFKPGEFRITHQPRIGAMLGGYVNAAGLAKLEAHPDVIGAGVPGRAKLGLIESVPFIYADMVHDELGYTGAGITVAVLDTGISQSNPDVQGDVAAGAYHYLKRVGGGVGGGAVDGHGHGTNIAAIITSPIGVAPDAKILPIKILATIG
ncbi:MAG: S8 family serine peptidase [Phycisphaerae bacterium]|nr:S8 family serine peptidase [Phycisphaerae bacterium]